MSIWTFIAISWITMALICFATAAILQRLDEIEKHLKK